MKTSKMIFNFSIFSSLCIALTMTACTPRDVKVVDDKTRALINSKKNGGGSPKSGAVSGEFTLGNYALSAFLAEKQIEAIEFAKLALGSLDASRTQYVVSTNDGASGQSGQKEITISSSKDVLEYANESGNWKAKATKSLQALITTKGENFDSLKITGQKLKSSADSDDQDKTYVNLFEDNYDLSVASVEGKADVLAVNLKIDGTIAGANGGKNSPNKITVTLQMTVDKASLLTSDVKIVKSDAAMTYPGPNGKTFNSAFQAEKLLVKVDGLCNKLEGSVAASAGPKNKYSVNFEGEQISVAGKNWSHSLVTCGKRPTVELSRLQIY